MSPSWIVLYQEIKGCGHWIRFRGPLQWRHNGHASVSNHQPNDCLLNRLFRRRSKKTSKLCVTGLCAANSPGTGEFAAQMASNAENVSIWWRHHGLWCDARIEGIYIGLAGWYSMLILVINTVFGILVICDDYLLLSYQTSIWRHQPDVTYYPMNYVYRSVLHPPNFLAHLVKVDQRMMRQFSPKENLVIISIMYTI